MATNKSSCLQIRHNLSGLLLTDWNWLHPIGIAFNTLCPVEFYIQWCGALHRPLWAHTLKKLTCPCLGQGSHSMERTKFRAFSRFFPGKNAIFQGEFNSLGPRQNGRHSADGIFKHNFFNENIQKLIKISMECLPVCSINSTSVLTLAAGR